MNYYKQEIPPEMVKQVAAKFGCNLQMASILARRGITSGDEAIYFLEHSDNLMHNPFLFSGMEDAVDRILDGAEEQERVLIFGDRDVDGITATTILYNTLKSLGLEVTCKIPTGDESYGLSIEAVEAAVKESISLIITVDNGISCVAEIAHANELGIDVIITDHHLPQEEVPQAYAIINPKWTDPEAKDAGYPFRDLSGCAVAYKLCAALRFAKKSGQELDLYGHTICLLNTRPGNDAIIIEAVKLRNLVEIARLTETIIPESIKISDTRLPRFFEGMEIFAWDVAGRKKDFVAAFGKGIDLYLLDLATEIPKLFPSMQGKSLYRLKEESRYAKYAEEAPGELDVLINLFNLWVRKKGNLFSDEDRADLQLAALGTIADIMPLRNENRLIVNIGIEEINKKALPGLSDLILALGLSGKKLDSHEISWQITPALNTAGRMGCPEKALQMLLSENIAERSALAAEIRELNEERKQKVEDSLELLWKEAEESLQEYQNKLVYVASDKLDPGIAGLVAGRFAGRFAAPAIAVSVNDTVCKGSIRSTGGFDLTFIMDYCKSLFVKSGGHTFATGFSIERANLQAFSEKLKQVAEEMPFTRSEEAEKIKIDAELPPAYLKPEVISIVDTLAPYGADFEKLHFLTQGILISDINFMGTTSQHVKLTLDAGATKWPAIYWRAAEKAGPGREFEKGDKIDLIYTMEHNYFNGQDRPQLLIEDLERSSK
ncbi:MAG: single-stranded-DNA-specific exonuclease RecJ [Spirochaetaceae bacterium]|jgi:single-stranded-DNA-specific exonuclease|nr:single-stranded-DNA-specific exonuclease RecJ [Spirochaetaceae bacterium]